MGGLILLVFFAIAAVIFAIIEAIRQVLLGVVYVINELVLSTQRTWDQISHLYSLSTFSQRFVIFSSAALVAAMGIWLFVIVMWYRGGIIKRREAEQRRLSALFEQRRRAEEEEQQRLSAEEYRQRLERQRQIEKHERERQDAEFRRQSEISQIKTLGDLELEKYVAGLFERLGYKASLTPGTGDHGVDVFLTNLEGKTEIVQCKQWTRQKIGERPIREFYGTVVAENAAQGYFVAPYGFSSKALRWAKGKNIILADAEWLAAQAKHM